MLSNKRFAKGVSRLALLAIAFAVGGAGLAPGFASAAGSIESVRGEQGQLLLDVTTIAGSNAPGDEDGASREATFRAPQGIVGLADGTLYIADTDNHRIRAVVDGQVIAVAGQTALLDDLGRPTGAFNDGDSEQAAFNQPTGLALDADGNLYVADAGNHAIRKIDAQGHVTTLAGNGVAGDQNGIGEQAGFHYPQAVVVDDDGIVYVADSLNHLIRRITPEGEVSTLNAAVIDGVEVLPGLLVETGGYRDGALARALFNEPSGLALDAKGNLYVSDTGNQLIRYIDMTAGTVSTVAGTLQEGNVVLEEGSIYAVSGYADGQALQAQFSFPRGLAIAADGGLLIADSLNHAVRYLHNGEVSTLAGSLGSERGWADGIEGKHGLHAPSALAVTGAGTIAVADSYNNRIRQIAMFRLPEGSGSDNDLRIVIGSDAEVLDVETRLQHGRTLAPVRAVTEALGYKVTYLDGSREALLEKDGLSVLLRLEEPVAEVSGRDGEAEIVKLDVAPFLENGVTYIPVRYISELIGLDVQYHAATKTVIIRNAIHLGGGE